MNKTLSALIKAEAQRVIELIEQIESVEQLEEHIKQSPEYPLRKDTYFNKQKCKTELLAKMKEVRRDTMNLEHDMKKNWWD